MTRSKLKEILTEIFSEGYMISPGYQGFYEKETGSFYVKKWSEKLNGYSPVFKVLVGNGVMILYGIHLTLHDDTKEFLIPYEESPETWSKSITIDFLNLFKFRMEEYLDIKKEYDDKLNALIKLKRTDTIQSEIRDFKLGGIFKSEKQE
jgi:hypothetical protein